MCVTVFAFFTYLLFSPMASPTVDDVAGSARRPPLGMLNRAREGGGGVDSGKRVTVPLID
jgi:hypothetical protein